MLVEKDGEWSLHATTAFVARVCVDSRLSLLIDSELGDAEIQCSGEFQIVDLSRHIDNTFTPSDDDLVGIGTLRGDLASLRVSRTGALEIIWVSGLTLLVRPNDRFEAWELATERLQLICMPGGEIAIFDARDQDGD